ncbi:YveK family protein [Lactobacillus helveticus]|uniref:Capsular polysaccharide biosynthesis protein CpsC n=1 Tax=Lactobacillus helveticus CNRZ32 TaxID=326425 RepID=A4ZGZ7_LACHE|nr:Wzz/FepE/Etk N-terminal domain-containing protein [Lactobacillus helveticus]ABH11589.1 capsular polysaccharide biosynthesis protein [Lactobacillus helveticus CNRZ32]AGQ22984.1 Tyrosine-protein kinase transmembrane modulator Wzd [Lactobacillus helveticus CNRZ32]MCT3417557.1 exopolysaccharide biosynthesis protein [Lactobacillus helveticus]NRD35392.1 exopolysaccharide biosynthesis protein [Lactobacillus helveticus]CDI62394.1 Capsular polysaccharide biosynthesis protein [Lactobacillus helveticu
MEQEQKQTDNTIDLTQLLQLCRRHIWALILWSVGLALVGWGIANFVISPKYTSSAQILVNQKSNKNDPNTAYITQQANMQLVNTYKDIVTSHVILQDASDRLANPVRVVKKAKPAKYKTIDGRKVLVRKAQPAVIERDGKSYSVSASQLAKNISVNTQQQSQVFSVSATADTPEKAKAEANAVARSFRDQIPNIMNIDNVTIFAPATNGVQSSPNVKMFTLAGFVIGLVLTFAMILIREMTNTTVRDDTYLTQDLGLTNLGYVSHFHVSSSFKLIKKNNNKPAAKREQRKRRRV